MAYDLAMCVGAGERAELHILVPHAEAARHALAISHGRCRASATRNRVVFGAADLAALRAALGEEAASA